MSLPRLPISDGTGSSLDEFVATVGMMGAFMLAIFGFSRRSRGGRNKTIGMGMIALALVVGAAAFVVPVRYLRARPAKIRIASTATLRILLPTPGQVVHRPTLDLAVDLKGGKIIQLASTKLKPDEGHLHVSIDGSLVSMTFGVAQQVDIRGLKTGEHTLEAEYVAADHGPFVPRVRQSVTFKVA